MLLGERHGFQTPVMQAQSARFDRNARPLSVVVGCGLDSGSKLNPYSTSAVRHPLPGLEGISFAARMCLPGEVHDDVSGEGVHPGLLNQSTERDRYHCLDSRKLLPLSRQDISTISFCTLH